MMLFKNIARLSISPNLSLAPMRPFFFSTSGQSSEPPPKTFEAASMNLSKTSLAVSSDQKPTTSPTSSKKKLSHQAQSAIWADRVIHFILNAKPLTNIHSYSLREQILRLQNPDNLHQFQAEPKEKVMRLFTQGVYLDSQIFDQNRVTSAKQTFIQNQIEQNNFIFCPNLLVTKQIFKTIMVLSSNFLVTGGFGISKTVSIILFIQLSNHVNSYLFKAAQPQHKDIMEELLYLKSVQVNPFFFGQETKDQQLEHPKLELPGYKKYFFLKIPRCWYWSIRSEQIQIQQPLRNILLSQAPQISQQKKNELRSIKVFQQFIRQLKRCYPPFQSYCMKVIVDQFNAVASRARQWNKKVDQYKSMSQDKINKDEYDQYEKDFKLRAQELIRLSKAAIYLSNFNRPSFVLNSSMSIQKDLLDSDKGKQSKKVYFDIQTDHRDFLIKEIRYLQELNGSLIDFLHKFWFEIERKLKIRNKDNIAIEEMKKLFLEEVKDKQVNYFSRFFFVRQYLTQKKIQQFFKRYDQFKKDGKLQNPFNGIYESFTQEYILKYKQKIRRYFLEEKTDSSLALLYALYDIAVLQSYTADKDNEITVNLKDLAKRIGQNPLELLNLDIYKEILPFTFTKDKESIKFYWKPEQFIQTIKDILFETSSDLIQDPLLITGLEQNYSHRGMYFKLCILQLLRKGADVTFFQPKLKYLPELSLNIEQDRFTTFQSFNQNYIGNHGYKIILKSRAKNNKRLKEKNKLNEQQALRYINKIKLEKPSQMQVDLDKYDVYRIRTSTIKKNLKDLFAMCDQYPKQFCFAIPYLRQNYDPNSECIDFIIAKKQPRTYHIYTFDVSTSRKTSKLSTTKKFLTELISRQNKYNYVINHVILCHKDAVRQVSYDPKGTLNIFYSPWDQMAFKNVINKQALKAFIRMVAINKTMNDTEEDIKKTKNDTEE